MGCENGGSGTGVRLSVLDRVAYGRSGEGEDGERIILLLLFFIRRRDFLVWVLVMLTPLRPLRPLGSSLFLISISPSRSLPVCGKG